MLLVDPEDSSKTARIKKSEIERKQVSQLSMMPKDLLKPPQRG